ncbi:KEOPS complex kinase/ATPase Bud32 [Vulcanisaeta thermophila]|uniref:KEOPS complex kinase/ATPase Bud32 n=1 Tax=Vulcanisaeta thermophila TaxID=867917 RepID=UPI00085365A5|nr:KEOPS complex kinase/ATPase Bud32 [Vulcanisaeta thermophila]
MSKIIAMGAEAILYLEDWLGMRVIVKERIPKGYRRREFDEYIRRFRTINEARALIRARELGVLAPVVYDVDVMNARIRMKYLRGMPLVSLIMGGLIRESLGYMEELGVYLGRLHRAGLVHGDPTPANALVVDGKLYMIDFGLSEFLGKEPTVSDSRAMYKLAIDLNVTLRSLEALRKDAHEELFRRFYSGYSSEVGGEFASVVLRFLRRVRSLVRYAVK